MELIIPALLLALGFVILIKGADWLVEGAVNIARTFNISELAIGLTIVAFGTSAPELIVNVLSSVSGYNEMSYGNIIGSNNFNLLFILGVAGIIYPLAVQKLTVKYEIPMSLLAALILFALVNDQLIFGTESILSRLDAFILLIFFGGFLYYVYRTMSAEPSDTEDVRIPVPKWKSVLFVVLGLAGLVIGGKLVVDQAVIFAKNFGLSEKFIGLTIVACGTSLPELATSVVAAFKKNTDIAIGNVIGSNIFNIFFILGVSGLIRPIPYNDVMNFDMGILFGGTALLFIFMFTLKQKMLDRWEAVLLLFSYFAYLVYLIIRN